MGRLLLLKKKKKGRANFYKKKKKKKGGQATNILKSKNQPNISQIFIGGPKEKKKPKKSE